MQTQATATPDQYAVPYSRLVLDDENNARSAKDYDAAGIAELAALIKAKGLIQPIVCREAKGDKLKVHAGKRRYLAIGTLIKSGDWPKEREIPVIVRDETDEEALETSLIENIGRKAMHPVAEFEIFAKLNADDKLDENAIAERYGITPQLVRQRLALGSLAPEIRKAWKDGRIEGDAARAFAVCPNKRTQAKAFKELSGRNHLGAHEVRRFLLNDRPKLTDPRVTFVGLDAYKAAGGTIVDDLFGNDGFIEDGALLKTMVAEKIIAECERLVREGGWGWAVPASDVGNYWSWERLRPSPEYTSAQSKRLKEIDKALDAINEDEELDYSDRDDKTEPLEAEKERIEHTGLMAGFTDKMRKSSGVVISLDGDELSITPGLKRPKSAKVGKSTVAADATEGDDGTETSTSPRAGGEDGISNALLLSITEAQTRAASKAVVEVPDLALPLAIAGLRAFNTAPVRITSAGFESDHDHDEFAKALGKVVKRGDYPVQLAAEVAKSLDLRLHNGKDAAHWHGKTSDPNGGAAFIAFLPVDVYTAAILSEFDPGDYFARASARVAIDAADEIGKAIPAEKADKLPTKKADLVQAVAELARKVGWLPDWLRHPEWNLGGAATKKRRKG